tara:strand:+ start:111 stop:635 length:525 start_codon:yes stop_codon:yes gene_type:complete
MKKNKLICIGSIGKPRGLNGEFFLNSYCSPKENILNYLDFSIENNKISDFKINYIKKINKKFYAKINSIDNIDGIKNYTNSKLFINSENLPKLTNDEVYWHELKGMQVEDSNTNDILGEVETLNNFGANDCLVIKPTNNSIDDKERLVPFVKETFIKSIDDNQKIIKVDWQKEY